MEGKNLGAIEKFSIVQKKDKKGYNSHTLCDIVYTKIQAVFSLNMIDP